MTRLLPIAITGLGCLSGAGMNLAESMDSMFRNERYSRPPFRFLTDHPVSYPVFELREELNIPLDGGEDIYARTSQLALAAALEALADAGWNTESLYGQRVGVCIGTTVGCSLNSDEFYRAYKDDQQPAMKNIERFLRSNPAALIAHQLKLDGPTQTVVNACSSGTDAIGIGASWLRAGACDIVIAGGADELARVTYAGFSSLMITDPEPCKPFDVGRKGLNLGEGAGILVMEASGILKEKTPRSYLLGYGSTSDAHHLTAPHPDGNGLKQALAEAFRTAEISPSQITFVNAHGTGTFDNDRVESRVLNDALPGVPFFSTKGYTGHTLGAAGGIEAAFTVACLQRGEIPASIGFTTPDPDLPTAPVSENTLVDGNWALSESLAFGGNNAVLIFGQRVA
jgi:3-oxoacyl-[acyl-carrier-protein] synthase-1/3-oxoacyl-[acyl-carrier-protein] synthase II